MQNTNAHYPAITYLSAPEMIRLVRRLGLPACIAGIAERIEHEFLRWNEFDKSARIACHSPVGVIELMPIADAEQYAFKYVNGHPSNWQFKLPTVMAFGVLADVQTGVPRLLSELTLTTAIRTAATSAVAARALARRNSRRMALIGNGAQSEFQALAFRDLVGIREVQLYDIDRAASEKLAANLRDQGLLVRLSDSVADAVRGADIVTTVTADKTNAIILTPEMVEPGMHINAVGGDCPGKTELARGVIEAASVFVEFEPQSRIEGEIQQMPADFEVTELWRVLAGATPGRRSDEEVTLFDSVGFALEDFAALGFIHEQALALGMGERLELLPETTDPKNLFGLLNAPQEVSTASS
ncbi:MAG: ornithine cyclodeaminase [Ottowia sp.]|uniref:ornithine cyclodeaminase n=1 Tax=Ottowia sp. TaxID=1898956 RepID=UPI003C72C7BD